MEPLYLIDLRIDDQGMDTEGRAGAHCTLDRVGQEYAADPLRRHRIGGEPAHLRFDPSQELG
ncbi:MULTISPECIES: hypothetical protein [unclassified Thiocapsa]|uniref:hypothetical protein n=1 Tax=unclassified Thiocapsa TaxID=2641286 RepID=UPI0035B1466B